MLASFYKDIFNEEPNIWDFNGYFFYFLRNRKETPERLSILTRTSRFGDKWKSKVRKINGVMLWIYCRLRLKFIQLIELMNLVL